VILQADLVDQYDSQTSAYPRPRCKSAGQASVANASSTPNGKADQRRITGLTLPLDAGRRLIQRLVLQNVLAGRTTYLRPDASNIFRHSSFGCDSACESTIAKGYRVIV
jgi:hypothetical protein